MARTFGTWLFRCAQHRPGLLDATLRPLRLIAPHHVGMAQMHAVLTARMSGWHKAAPLFLRMDTGRRGQAPTLPQHLLSPAQPAQGLRLSVPQEDRAVDLPVDLARRIIVYTVCFGSRPYLPPLLGQPEGLRFLCITDAPVQAPGWEVIVMAPRPESEAFATICPHRVLAEAGLDAEWSLFVDRALIPVGNLHTLITRWLMHQDMVLWRHPAAHDWQGLAEHLLLTGRHPAASVLAQAQAYEAADVPHDQGASDTGMIWRRHSDPAVQAQMDAWWALHEAEPAGHPSLSWYRLAQEKDVPDHSVTLLPSALGTAEHNIFFARNVTELQALRPRLPSPALHTRRIPITFLYAEQRRNSGITLMRARQLSEMVADTYSDRYDVTLTSDIRSVRDQVVIVNRGAIEFNPPEHLADLRDRNIVSVSDWLDMPIRPKTVPVFDAHMAFSLPQAVELNRLYPATPAFHVTHHVNPAVPDCAGPTDRLRTGYFGRLANTSRPSTLSDVIELVNVVDASFTAEDWVRQAPLFNCHWIVRELDHLQEWKPFLKAFVAARCGAVVIVTRDDMNAMHYLGDDYPFYADSLAPEDLEMAWARTASAFGGKDWQKAQAIMRQVKARSSDRQVMVEFKAMLDEILA
ncbi:hypothetical protein [Falsirhodobacter sp. 1013]|uniref:hypothetical protein n=1 Tax=Falsirhodobacter sp. 1013 TaxID=3417566 RepID=UPI003EB94C28